jgi:hypothetical protein
MEWWRMAVVEFWGPLSMVDPVALVLVDRLLVVSTL